MAKKKAVYTYVMRQRARKKKKNPLNGIMSKRNLALRSAKVLNRNLDKFFEDMK